ncbi:hypothetical protein BCR32DRAFT_327676 [Anaeromyces robustus]|uniref:Uncharacterized protein n=1 Tax=Anaeromyces robustus TaxID=1754192 RepID=A0A1Y1X4G9_9FUNG|nr:hypothetical protein BCR32DRAFT_327676 [Anaeromyces robustus]|eukprot:ORX80545.1 hypothetical protein BCR32DRAFT_327676 [Anaeromyces robustus]
MKLYNIIILFNLFIIQILGQVVPICQGVTQKYSNCIKSFFEEDIDSKCGTYVSVQCQQLYNSPETVLKDCEQNIIEVSTSYLKEMNNNLKCTCAKNEKGEYCPLSKIIKKTLKNPNIFKEKKYSEIFDELKESCSSKKCVEIGLFYLESLLTAMTNDKNHKFDNEEIRRINDLISYVKNCHN